MTETNWDDIERQVTALGDRFRAWERAEAVADALLRANADDLAWMETAFQISTDALRHISDGAATDPAAVAGDALARLSVLKATAGSHPRAR